MGFFFKDHLSPKERKYREKKLAEEAEKYNKKRAKKIKDDPIARKKNEELRKKIQKREAELTLREKKEQTKALEREAYKASRQREWALAKERDDKARIAAEKKRNEEIRATKEAILAKKGFITRNNSR